MLQTWKKNIQDPLVALHPELCDLHIPTVILSLGKRKGLGHSHVLSRYARKNNLNNPSSPHPKKEKPNKNPLQSQLSADLVQMEGSFKQKSGNVLLHHRYSAPKPDGVLMITGLEATYKQSNTWQNSAGRKTWFDMKYQQYKYLPKYGKDKLK